MKDSKEKKQGKKGGRQRVQKLYKNIYTIISDEFDDLYWSVPLQSPFSLSLSISLIWYTKD